MANNKMLIDAGHPEETRVVVVRGNRVEEFDFESESRRQLRGNIYLAKVTRVEPSLQAAFVDYGGNRHGFLAFSEIHPDYYQIPVADRQALIEEEQRQDAAEADESDEAEADARAGSTDDNGSDDASGDSAAADASSLPSVSESDEDPESQDTAQSADGSSDRAATRDDASADDDGDDEEADEPPEAMGSGDALEEVPVRRKPRARHYKIQEVIKRRQIMLVQVVKEERGNKGAALTTYLSLAGRYAVLMPNTARGGGISRKITSLADRKRLKQVVSDLDMPEGMGVILRTAGAARTKIEVKRDFEYLLRLWENVRELTLKSSAPTMVYEEGSLIKRSIRDLYNKDIDEILVAGEAAHREAKDFMRMLMPSHARNVKRYTEPQPLLAGSGIETQLDAMFLPQVTLKSGGYIVINQTEALVSIDVNSGRSTREHNIEDTALQTNLEASDEVARQLRLRDLAGLIVIDFIDMDEKRNNRAVERRLKEALKNDRARIQVGRISPFGLMEMSRQRLRTGVLESTTTVCTACHGNGYVRAPSSVALHVLRSLEDHLLKNSSHDVTVRTSTDVALYILNNKRAHLAELEERFGLDIAFAADDAIADGAHFAIERGARAGRRPAHTETIQPDSVAPVIEAAVEVEEDIPVGDEADEEIAILDEVNGEDVQAEEASSSGRRRRRRRRRGGSGQQAETASSESDAASAESAGDAEAASGETESDDAGDSPTEVVADGEDDQDDRPRRRRRGRRGGRRNRRSNGDAAATSDNGEDNAEAQAVTGETVDSESVDGATDDASAADRFVEAVAEAVLTDPAPAGFAEPADSVAAASTSDAGTPAFTAEEPLPVRETPARDVPAEDAPIEVNGQVNGHSSAEDAPQPEAAPSPEVAPVEPVTAAREEEPVPSTPEPEADEPKRRGWWQRRSFF